MQEQNGLRYAASISRAREVPSWQGYSGRVEDFCLPERLADTLDLLGLAPGALGPDVEPSTSVV
ncbi:MAG: hypothetical protein HOI95_19695 [Chromatiales bacterium]|nr:hypothetical protein [Chromatiales bacterium]